MHRSAASSLAVALGGALCVLPATPGNGLAATPPEPPVASLRDQLIAAQAANDRAAVIEICRRLLAEAGKAKGAASANPSPLLDTLFRAQLDEHDFERAGGTLDAMEKANARPAGAVGELRGDLALAAGKPVDALQAWRAALHAPGADTASLLGKLADLSDRRGEWREAVDGFNQFLKKRPGHVARRARLAVCLLNLGRLDEAEKEIRAASAKDATDATVKAALPLFDRLRTEAATLRALGTKIATAPNDRARFAPLLERAYLLFTARAFPAALEDSSQALAALPDSRAATLLKSQCLWQLNRNVEAGRLQVGKMPASGWLADRAKFARLQGLDLTIAAPAEPAKLAAAHAGRAAELLAADQPFFALPDAAAAARLNPRSAEAAFVHAAALLRCNRMNEALAEAGRATEIDPGSAEAWAILGRLEQEARADLTAAVSDLTRALAIREDPHWLQRRERCLRATGRTAEADQDARRLRELQPPRSAPTS
jgi:tetratricopeptide (TPR) repeat protein